MKAAKVGTDRVAKRRFVDDVKNKNVIECYWCGDPTEKGARHIDHIIPVSRHGTDDVYNLCCSCPACNCSKNDLLPEEFTGQFHIHFGILPADTTPRRNTPPRLQLQDIEGILLTDRQRQIFEMRFTKRMGCTKIARAMGVSVKGVADSIQSIRQKIRLGSNLPVGAYRQLSHRRNPGPPKSDTEASFRSLYSGCNISYEDVAAMAERFDAALLAS